LDKRDGSHWELFDCDDTVGEDRQTVKAVCTNNSEFSNCDDIFLGRLEETVLEMPGHCGPGKYAVAVSMKRSEDHEHLKKRLFKRGLGDAPIYDLTFDYDFTPIQKRDTSGVLLRIDYSDHPGYYASIVDSAPGSKLRKREIDMEIETHFGGNHKAWLAHRWNIEKRTLTHEELHKRWWSTNFGDWLDRMSRVDYEWTGIRHRIQVRYHLIIKSTTLTHYKNSFTQPIFSASQTCEVAGIPFSIYANMQADMNINVQASAGVTLVVS
jgi:chitinase